MPAEEPPGPRGAEERRAAPRQASPGGVGGRPGPAPQPLGQERSRHPRSRTARGKKALADRRDRQPHRQPRGLTAYGRGSNRSAEAKMLQELRTTLR